MSQQPAVSPSDLTEREVKTLHKLLVRFASAPYNNPEHGGRIASMIRTVDQWVKWYANEVVQVDL